MEWVERHPERESAEQVLRPLAEAVGSLVPQGATAGIADIDGARSIIAVAEGIFLRITIDLSVAEEEGELPDRWPEVTCRAHPLDRGSATIDVREHHAFRQRGPAGFTQVRRRHWTLNLAEPIEISTTEGLQAPFERERGPSSAELVVRAAARELGWDLPGGE
jgi:hypothetical protein